jgi:hypothetical protein
MTSAQVLCNVRQQIAQNKIAVKKARLEAKVVRLEAKSHTIVQKALLAERLTKSH